MKKLVSLSNKEILNYVMSSKELRENLDEYISRCEMDWVGEKLACFSYRGADWSIGAYNHNYLRVRDCDEFVASVEKSISYFDCTEQLRKLVKQCKRLWGTNLYDYMVGKLCDMYYEQELKPIVEWMEKCSYYIYNEDANDDLLDYIDCFADSYLDDIYLNDKNEMVRRTLIA